MRVGMVLLAGLLVAPLPALAADNFIDDIFGDVVPDTFLGLKPIPGTVPPPGAPARAVPVTATQRSLPGDTATKPMKRTKLKRTKDMRRNARDPQRMGFNQ